MTSKTALSRMKAQILELVDSYDKAVTEVLAAQSAVPTKALVNDNRKKLAFDDVRRIRTEYRTGRFSQRELADWYNVNPATVSRIVRGQYHRSVY